MRPEAAAGVRDARGRVCHCPADGPRRPLPPRGPERMRRIFLRKKDYLQPESGGDQQTRGSKGAFGFQHPVRLYLPISKRQEYLQSSGEKVLASFPVQATIHFYNDESDSDNEDEQEEENQSSKLLHREMGGLAEDSPGGKGRGQPTKPGCSSMGHSGLGGQGLLPHGDSLGDTERASPK